MTATTEAKWLTKRFGDRTAPTRICTTEVPRTSTVIAARE